LTAENVCSRPRSLTDLRARDAPADGQVITPLSQTGLGSDYSFAVSKYACLSSLSLSGSQCDVARSNFNKRSDEYSRIRNFRFADLRAPALDV